MKRLLSVLFPGPPEESKDIPISATDEARFDDRRKSKETQQSHFADSLIEMIEQQTGGPPDSPWLRSDFEGGDVSFFAPGLCLVVRQTVQAHDEIASMLTAIAVAPA